MLNASNKTCDLLCTETNKYICAICCALDENKGHDFKVLEDLCNSKKIGIKMDIRELEKIISPTYVDIANNIENQIANLGEEYDKLTIYCQTKRIHGVEKLTVSLKK